MCNIILGKALHRTMKPKLRKFTSLEGTVTADVLSEFFFNKMSDLTKSYGGIAPGGFIVSSYTI